MPFVIIGVVLIAVIGVIAVGTGLIGTGLWLSSVDNSTQPAKPSSTTATVPAQKPSAANAPAGAPIGVNMTGSTTATVTVEEFADYQCGGCAAAHPIMNEVKAAYAGNKNFRFVFRHLPLAIPAHDKSFKAALATEAAGFQGKFWQFQDLLFRNQAAWTANPNYLNIWEEYASSIGIDVEKFRTDIDGSIAKQRVDADIMRARGLAVSATPTVLVNGQVVPTTAVAVRAAVDAAIQQATASSASNSSAPAANATNK